MSPINSAAFTGFDRPRLTPAVGCRHHAMTGVDATMVMQVHDELVFEVKEG
ncbi:hypothetical protein [Halomonas sp. PR-M31]|uniref:hypothetical protein n=1 Tax=Halomonas sp. PR-M31 TaxID=1471202 RepID=UPI000AD1C6DB|nr:hypothetical protein [Halomonas sp. PR-M31]